MDILELFKEIKLLNILIITVIMTLLITLVKYFLMIRRQHKELLGEVEKLKEITQKLRQNTMEKLESKSSLSKKIRNELEDIKKLEENKEFDLAKQKLKELEKRYGQEIEFVIQFANFNLELNMPDKSEKFLLSKEDAFKDEPRYYSYLGWFYDEIGNINKGLKAFQKALELKDDPQSYLNLSYSYWRLNNLEEAIAIGERGLQLKPDEKTEAQIKSNLSYFYAQGNLWNKKNNALTYAEFAKDRYNKFRDTAFIANYAYVKMRFAENLDELNDAITYLLKIKNKQNIQEEIDEYLEEAYKKATTLLRK